MMKLGSLSPKPFLLILGEDYKLLVKYLYRYGSVSSLVLIHFPLFFKTHQGILGIQVFFYLPHDYNNYKKLPKQNAGRDGEEA